jgi:molybdenum cofactor cytidylyltransferase
VVLAAGAGRRFGGGKLLAPFGDGLLLDKALASAFAAPVRRVVLATGDQGEAVAQAARAFAERIGRSDRLKIVEVPDHAEGMGASLRTAIATLGDDVEAVFVFLGDMPRIPNAVLEPLARAVAGGAPAAAASFEGRRGHPAVFARALFPALLSASGDQGARAVLQTLGADLVLVEAGDNGVLVDIDTPRDLAAASGLAS